MLHYIYIMVPRVLQHLPSHLMVNSHVNVQDSGKKLLGWCSLQPSPRDLEKPYDLLVRLGGWQIHPRCAILKYETMNILVSFSFLSGSLKRYTIEIVAEDGSYKSSNRDPFLASQAPERQLHEALQRTAGAGNALVGCVVQRRGKRVRGIFGQATGLMDAADCSWLSFNMFFSRLARVIWKNEIMMGLRLTKPMPTNVYTPGVCMILHVKKYR